MTPTPQQAKEATARCKQMRFAFDGLEVNDKDKTALDTLINLAQSFIDGEIGVCMGVCPRCQGQGWYADHAPSEMHDADGTCNGNCPIQKECEDWGGSGKVALHGKVGKGEGMSKCPKCNGNGEINTDRRGIDGNTCDECDGTGKVAKPEGKLVTKEMERAIDLLDSLYEDISDGTFDKKNNRTEYLDLIDQTLKEIKEMNR